MTTVSTWSTDIESSSSDRYNIHGPPMESPGAVTHPGWSSRNKVTGNSTGNFNNTNGGNVELQRKQATRNSKTKFGLSRKNSSTSNNNNRNPLGSNGINVGDNVLAADLQYEFQHQQRFANSNNNNNIISNQMYNVAGGGIMYQSNQQYNANLIPNQHFSTNSNNMNNQLYRNTPSSPTSSKTKGSITNAGTKANEMMALTATRGSSHHPYFTDAVNEHTMDYKNIPLEKLPLSGAQIPPPIKTPPRQKLNANTMPQQFQQQQGSYPLTNTQIQMRQMQNSMMMMMQQQQQQQTQFQQQQHGMMPGAISGRANELEGAPAHIKHLAANLINQYGTIASATSSSQFQQTMSNLPSTIRAEKLRSPTRKVRRGDLTWPENDLRHLPPSPKAVPLSSSLRQSEADQEIFSETVDSLNNATKPTFDGSADEWENYLASRKLDPDDDSENDFPNTIEDANKKIQEQLKDISTLKIGNSSIAAKVNAITNAKNGSSNVDEKGNNKTGGHSMDWKAYNRFEQFAGEDVVLFEETINPPSQKTTSSVNRDNYNNNNNNIAPPVPTHLEYSNAIPPPSFSSQRPPLVPKQQQQFQQQHLQQQQQPRVLQPSVRPFYDSLDGPIQDAFPQNLNMNHNNNANNNALSASQYYNANNYNLMEQNNNAIENETNNIINSFDIPQVSRVPLHMPASSEQQSIEQPVQYHRIDESDIQFNRENVLGLFSNDNAIKEDEKLKEQYERLQNMVLNSSANNNAVNSAFTNMTNNTAIESTEKSAFMNVKRPIPIRRNISTNEDKLEAGVDEHKKQRPFSSFTHKFNTDQYIMQNPFARQLVSNYFQQNAAKATITKQEDQVGQVVIEKRLEEMKGKVGRNNGNNNNIINESTTDKRKHDYEEEEQEEENEEGNNIDGDDDDDALIEKEYQRLEMKAKSKVLKVKQMQRKKEKLIEKSRKTTSKFKYKRKPGATYFDPSKDMYKNNKNRPLTRKMWEKKSLQRRKKEFEDRRRVRLYRDDSSDENDFERNRLISSSSSDDEETMIQNRVEEE